MKWNEQQLRAVLPQRLRGAGLTDVRELRLRLGQRPCLVTGQGVRELEGVVTEEELRFLVNAASRYSPWSATTMAQGYLTAAGGHRIGLCGEGAGESLRQITSVCIRIARDCTGIAAGLPMEGNLLIIGPPGSGKTTLLREYLRQRARIEAVGVVDERREIFPEGFDRSGNLDVLCGVSKERGLDMVLRCMSPRVIGLDEITCEEDCRSLIRAARCGVDLVATAHAGSVRDLRERQIYRMLLDTGLFPRAAVLDRSQSWHIREVMPCSV